MKSLRCICLLLLVPLAACGAQPTPPGVVTQLPAPATQAADVSTATSNPEQTTPAEPTATATAEPTVTPQPTTGPTATAWPPVFEPASLQDIRGLDSFVITVNEKNTVNGSLTELTHTIGYLKEPYSAYHHNQYTGGLERTYVIDGMTYTQTGTGDWYISAGSNDDLFARADIPEGNTERLREAQFAGLEDFEGIPAYHFVLDPGQPEGAAPNTQLEGDFYIAQEGSYVLYSRWKETASQDNFSQAYEVTTTMSSINQLAEIQIPADMQEMVTAAELPVEMGLPLPDDSALTQMIRYQHGIGVDLYYFSVPQMGVAEFLDMYRDLPATGGWQVTHVGHVNLHESDCEFTQECVMISQGSTQVILHYNGNRLRAEFDWPHLYAPLQ